MFGSFCHSKLDEISTLPTLNGLVHCSALASTGSSGEQTGTPRAASVVLVILSVCIYAVGHGLETCDWLMRIGVHRGGQYLIGSWAGAVVMAVVVETNGQADGANAAGTLSGEPGVLVELLGKTPPAILERLQPSPQPWLTGLLAAMRIVNAFGRLSMAGGGSVGAGAATWLDTPQVRDRVRVRESPIDEKSHVPVFGQCGFREGPIRNHDVHIPPDIG